MSPSGNMSAVENYFKTETLSNLEAKLKTYPITCALNPGRKQGKVKHLKILKNALYVLDVPLHYILL